MRYDDLSPDKHQIIHAHPRPLSLILRLLRRSSCASRLRTHFAALVQKQPDVVTLLDLAHSARDIRAVVEDERDHELGGLDGFLHGEKLFSEELSGLSFAEEGGFRLCFGREGNVGVGAEALG